MLRSYASRTVRNVSDTVGEFPRELSKELHATSNDMLKE